MHYLNIYIYILGTHYLANIYLVASMEKNICVSVFHVAVSLRYASASAFREGHRSGSSTQISGLQIFVL